LAESKNPEIIEVRDETLLLAFSCDYSEESITRMAIEEKKEVRVE